MSPAEFGILYVVVGALIGVVWLIRDRGASLRAELVLLVPFWPLYAPFLLLAARSPSTGWAGLALSGQTLALLDGRIEEARRSLAEIDRRLLRPEFDSAATECRVGELEAQGASAAAERARARLDNIRRLAEIRADLSAELTAIEELSKNVRVQMELVQWTGRRDEQADGLLFELESRVEGLDLLLGHSNLVAKTDLRH